MGENGANKRWPHKGSGAFLPYTQATSDDPKTPDVADAAVVDLRGSHS